MKQVIQDIRSGRTGVYDLPDPIAQPGQVVVATAASLVSAGTERYVVELARKSLIGKARERPDQVRRLLQKLKQEGVVSTVSQVMAKLAEPMPLGYSSAGVVVECGRGVQEFKPGDRVATTGPHAGVVSVGRNQCARIPDNVTFEQGSYTSVGAIALEGVRLAQISLGDSVVVVGLGLVGLLTVGLLKANGCRVFGLDVDPRKLDLGRRFGADQVGVGTPHDAIRAFSGANGVDAAIITASTESNEPIEFAAEVCRRRGRIVLVGVAGMKLPRAPFFQKELEFTVSSSLGPGRSDPAYEEKGIDYPAGYVRWTMQRNMEAVLKTIAAGRLPVEHLTTHRLPIDRAEAAYDLITRGEEPCVGIIIEYPNSGGPSSALRRRLDLRRSDTKANTLGCSVIGTGNFARLILLPNLARLGKVTWRGLCSARGMNARWSGDRMRFAFAATDAEEIWRDGQTQVVFIATRHDLHTDLVIAGLRAGKHVFVEKPLCIRLEELRRIRSCLEELGPSAPILMVGYNRRFARATGIVRDHFTDVSPMSVNYRFASALVPPDAWPQDEDVGGGRLVGEACHAIDACIAISKSPVVRVYAESVALSTREPSDDRVFITMRHEDGSISHVSYQCAGASGLPGERIEVFGGGRTALVDNWDSVELWTGTSAEKVRAGRDRGHAAELETFLNACRCGGDWPIPWEQLESGTWAALAASQSLRDGMAHERE